MDWQIALTCVEPSEDGWAGDCAHLAIRKDIATRPKTDGRPRTDGKMT